MNEPLPLGIALIPDSPDIEYLVKLNRTLQAIYRSQFRLEHGPVLIPHVSLFQGRFEARNIPFIEACVQEEWRRISSPLTLKTRGLNLWLNEIVFLDLEPTPYLQSLQQALIRSIDPLRAHHSGPADPQELNGLGAAEQYSMSRYSYPFAGPAFRPHFTIGRIEGPSNSHCLNSLTSEYPLPTNFTFSTCVLFDVGMFGRLEGIRTMLKHETQLE